MIPLEGFILLNAGMDALALYLALLWLDTGRIRLPRVVCAAFLGAVYAYLAWLPGMAWLRGAAGRLVCALVMVRVAAGSVGWKAVFKGAGFLVAAAFLSGGAASAIALALPGAQTPWALLAGACAAGCVGHAWLRRSRRLAMPAGEMVLRYRTVQLRCEAAVDTGNQALDSLTGLPLLVVPYECARRGFPTLTAEGLPEGMRLTAVRTITGSALLPCFQPDLLLWNQEERKAVVAIAPKGMLRIALAPPSFALEAQGPGNAGRRYL